VFPPTFRIYYIEYIIYDHKKNYVHQKVPSRSGNCTWPWGDSIQNIETNFNCDN